MVDTVALRRLAFVVTATVAAASVVPPTRIAVADDAASEAKRHYEEGTKAFNLGEFPRAIAEFKATYNVKPDPLLLYNIAQSYRLAGDASQALFFYKSFLRNMPGANNRKEVDAQIRKLEKQVQADDQKHESAAGAAPEGAGAPVVASPRVTAAPPPMTAPPPEAVAAPAVRATRPPPSPVVASPPPAAVVTSAPLVHPPLTPPPLAPAPLAGRETHIDLSEPASPPQEEARPIYKKWWFWAGAAGAVLIVGVVASANAKKGPTTTLGTYDPVFK